MHYIGHLSWEVMPVSSNTSRWSELKPACCCCCLKVVRLRADCRIFRLIRSTQGCFKHQASLLVVVSLAQFLTGPEVPIILGTCDVIYHCTMVVRDGRLESKFPKHTGDKSYVA